MVNPGYCRHIWHTCWEQSTFRRRGGNTLLVRNFIRVSEAERTQAGIGWELPSSPGQLLCPRAGSSTLTTCQAPAEVYLEKYAQTTSNFKALLSFSHFTSLPSHETSLMGKKKKQL